MSPPPAACRAAIGRPCARPPVGGSAALAAAADPNGFYCRHSTLIQVERNREYTLRQYDLVSRAAELVGSARRSASSTPT